MLFEVATVAAGLHGGRGRCDALGRGLKLPPWEEAHRADIESALAPVTY